MSDVPVRIELMRIKRLLTTLSETVQSALGSSSVLVVENTSDLSLRDAGVFSVVFMKENDSHDFGIYFPEETTDPIDGTEWVQDINGKTFQLFR
jgi:hypothetical protein